MKKGPDYIFFEDNPQKKIDDLVKDWQPDHISILVDENTRKHCLPLLKIETATVIEISSGERNKTLSTCEQIWQQMTEAGMSRKSLLINLGGGVIGDMGGFTAATYKRGIRFINVPTTLLAQVDASIGGKLGIDFHGLKNHIGIFKDPNAVILSPIFFKTLSERQLRSGFAEVIKHGLIWDKAYYDQIKSFKFPHAVDWEYVLKRSVEIKGEVVTNDPLEKGLRKILNFGHTIGHAIETEHLENGLDLLHGEAIAAGMIMELHLSHQLNWINSKQLEEVSGCIIDLFGKTSNMPETPALLSRMKQDKKNEADSINFSLLQDIGKCSFDVKADVEMIEKSISFYLNL